MRMSRQLLAWTFRACLIAVAQPELTSAATVTDTGATVAAPEAAVGDWQYPDKLVWIHIEPNGMALQCRIAPSGNTFKSKGRFVSASRIRWEQIWGIDRVALKAGALSLSGKWGSFRYERSVEPIAAPCLAD